MGFYGSLMDIFDQKKTVIHDKNNFVSLMDIFDPKKVIHDKNNFVSFMDIFDQKKKFCIQ